MRTRELVSVGAGIAGTALAHGLDTAGQLPGVHEAVTVRAAMGPLLTAGWLALAAALAWLAVRHGPVRIGAPASLLVSAVPELVGRHDLGAVVEPGAVAGALVQWLVLLAVVAALVIAGRTAPVALVLFYADIVWPCPQTSLLRLPAQAPRYRGRPRAPPDPHLSGHVV